MSGAGDMAMLGRVMGGLIVVLVVIGLVARVARRSKVGRGELGLRVVERIGLSRDANLAVVEVSNRTLLLGVTPQGVTMLAELGDAYAAVPEAGHESAFAESPAESLADDLVGESPLELEPEPVQDRPIQDLPVRDLPVRELPARNLVAQLEAKVALDEYPDLATALRAAGRTANAQAVADTTPAETSIGPIAAPRTRAEARARRSTDQPVVSETPSAPIPLKKPTQPNPAQPKAAQPKAAQPKAAQPKPAEPKPQAKQPASIPQQRTQQQPQASGSVLSPKTWRQGIDALRELTIRRG